MKLLKKLLLIHWHYFSREVIEFEKINFLTGKNASGKSTIIDALQLVFLADTSGTYFNKAANGKSSRTLAGYLRGELGDDGDSGVRCLRNGRFTSYIVLEFYDDIKNSCFSAGCCFDFYSEGDIPRMFFRYDGPIPESYYLVNKVPMDIKAFRQYLKSNYPNTKSFTTEINRDFKDDFYGRLGGLQNRFGELLRKAVPFDPIADIQKFITTFVCEEQQNVDVSLMQENIRNYRALEDEAASLEERKERLLNIVNTYESYKSFAAQEYLYSYLIIKAQLEGNVLEYFKVKDKIDENNQEITTLDLEISGLTKRRDQINEERNEKIADLKNNNITQTIENLERNKTERLIKIQKIEENYRKYFNLLKKNVLDWQSKMKTIIGVSKLKELLVLSSVLQERIKGTEESVGDFLKDIQTLHQIEYGSTMNYDVDGLQLFVSRVQAIERSVLSILERIEEEQTLFAKDKLALEKEHNKLKEGIFKFPDTTVDLREAIYAELSSRFGIDVQVSIVAELIEIKNERWRNAIEGYLNNQKFNIIVAPEHFNLALKVYNRIKEHKNIYGVGLVDIDSITKAKHEIKAGSLAEEIDSNNKYAGIYMDYLLGRVIKCDDVDQLKNNPISITDQCMLYQGYVARRMNPQSWEKPAIGQGAIKRRLEKIVDEINACINAVNSCAVLKKSIERLKDFEVLSISDIGTIIDYTFEYSKIPEIQEEIDQINKELSYIDKSSIIALQDLIDQLKTKISQYETKLDEQKNRSSTLKEQIRTSLMDKLPALEDIINSLKLEISGKYATEWLDTTGNPRYKKEAFSKNPLEIERNFYSPFKKAELNKSDTWRVLRDSRREYNSIYKMGYNEDSEENNEYDDAWLELSEVELPKYVVKIEDARRKAFEQFQEDFLSRLQFNIRAAETQIDQLNEALRGYSFGEDQYQFKIIPKSEYKRFYAMITDNMLLDSGYNLLSAQFNEKYKEEITELFSIITESGKGSRNQERDEYERRIQEFTNYRTYLSFDLEVKNPNGETQRLSRTLGTKSGGETQTPFYIAVLASFAQLYRIGRDKNANTARIIIFDEAFSKMDGDRIVQSIDLLRKFDFQVILSAPPDKIGDIATLVDRNMCVLRQGKKVYVRCFKPRQIGDFYDAD